MTSESARSILERLISSRNRDFSPLVSLILGLNTSENGPDETRAESPESEPDPDDNSVTRSTPNESTRQERNRNLSHFFSSLLSGSIPDPNDSRVESPESETDPDENSANRPSPDESTQRVRSRNLSFLTSLILGFTTPETDPNDTRVESPESEPNPDENSVNRSSPDESTQRVRNIDLSFLTSFILGFTRPVTDPNDPRVETPESEPDPNSNPTNQSRGGVTVVIVGGEGRRKVGYPPAAKSAVEMMPRVEIREGDEVEERECVICLEKMTRMMKKMPCQHVFHEECIEKWLGLHGTCPTCRYKMPVDDDVDGQRVNREFWVRISFGGGRSDRRGGGDRTGENEIDM